MSEKDNGTGIGGKFTTGKIDEEEENGLGNKHEGRGTRGDR